MSEVDPIELPAPAPQKADAEGFALRGSPRPVARFRKSVIIGGTAIGAAVLIALTWTSLKPATFRALTANEGGRPFERPSPEALAGAPRDYRDVPQLGPPLPGDLGRPILERQRELAASEAAPEMRSPDPAIERAEAERQRRAAAEVAARNSSLVVQLSKAGANASPPVPTESAPAALPSRASLSERKVELGDWDTHDVNDNALLPAPSRWTIAAGTMIPASLITGLNSDLPGMVLAQVSENVRDSATGRTVLIPQGARLIGRYDSGLKYGQKRALVVWQRILFPDGSSLRLDNMPASDSAGFAGVSDRVDGHSWQLIKGVVLSSLLGVGSQLSLGGEDGIARAIRESAQTNGTRAGEQIVSRGLDVQPTVTVRPGWPVRVLVSEDLVLEPWKE
jgi:type IV secretion system protein VirB10